MDEPFKGMSSTQKSMLRINEARKALDEVQSVIIIDPTGEYEAIASKLDNVYHVTNPASLNKCIKSLRGMVRDVDN